MHCTSSIGIAAFKHGIFQSIKIHYNLFSFDSVDEDGPLCRLNMGTAGKPVVVKEALCYGGEPIAC